MAPVLYRGAALVDPERRGLVTDMSLLVDGERLISIRPTDDEGELPDGTQVVDASGSTAIAGMVDAHSHLTLPGGAHWIDRGFDPTGRLLEAAERNAVLL